ncbi:hypothetical protein PoB_007141800 [Plakobranchus ocellatus]|uniref:Uncharacterized protein n=1 Tax=Plakobranchus ocellatus TaxID=259542 RepID=A0AAV4DKU5_9GAST|nr:hypothetical protein PoB_007141800 [Plakobranchus ocellatus]
MHHRRRRRRRHHHHHHMTPLIHCRFMTGHTTRHGLNTSAHRMSAWTRSKTFFISQTHSGEASHKIIFKQATSIPIRGKKSKRFTGCSQTEQSVTCLCGGTVSKESALRFAGTFLSRVLASSLAPWPDGGPESLRSP